MSQNVQVGHKTRLFLVRRKLFLKRSHQNADHGSTHWRRSSNYDHARLLFRACLQLEFHMLTYKKRVKRVDMSSYLINNRRMFNVGIVDFLAEKPYIPHKSLHQWICCKCLEWYHRQSYFWPPRSWRLLEAKNTPWRPKMAWRSWSIEKSI